LPQSDKEKIMAAQHAGSNITEFLSGMHAGYAGFVATAHAMRLAPAAPAAQAAAEFDHCLKANEMLMLPDASRKVICLAGEIWITRDGDIEDYILGAGRELVLRPGDQAAIQALRPSRVRVEAG
jgi:hypothetical protein